MSSKVWGCLGLFWWVHDRFLRSKRLIISIRDAIWQFQKTRGVCARVPTLSNVFGPGRAGGQHALFRWVLYRFSRCKELIISILDAIQRIQKTRGVRARVPTIFSVFVSGGVGGQYTAFWWVLDHSLRSKRLILSNIDAIFRIWEDERREHSRFEAI